MSPFRRPLFMLAAVGLLAPVACSQNRLEGTYVLERRELADGTIVCPPDIAGCMSIGKSYRNFNVMWKDSTGKPVSIGYFAKYRLRNSPNQRRYTEHAIYRVSNNWPEGADTTYDLSQPAASVDVQKRGEHLEFDLPLYDEPHVEFCPCGFKATKAGEFTDCWRRVP